MDARPPKRQRRSIRTETDSQGTQSSTNSSRLSKQSVPLLSRPKASERARTVQTPSTRIPSSSPSPKKTGSPKKAVTSQSLHSFFKPATEDQRWSSQKFEAKRSLPTVTDENILDADVIEDDYDSYDEIFTQHFASAKVGPAVDTKATSGLSRTKRPASRQTTASRSNKQHSKRFLMPAGPECGNKRQSSRKDGSEKPDHRPWAQRFAPSSLDEIAVHKRKISDVQKWLEGVFTGRCRERLLVLRGPAGCGKTTTVTLLSESLGFDVVEWRNPAVSEYTGRDYVSASAQFEEFLARGDRFGGLDLDDGIMEPSTHRNAHAEDRRILLVEEFPTVLHRASSSLTAFRASLQRYLAASTEHGAGWHPPIVMVVSETLLSSASSILDNLTVHRLLGPTLYNHPSTTIIDFNSVAPTFMHKALRSILDKEARVSQRARIPSPAVLGRISEIGDIRSAVSSLEFLCLKGDQVGKWGGSLTKSKKPRGETSLTPMEEESLKLISQREASLGMFHAVGKIVYNKRLDPSLVPDDATVLPSPPDHLSHHRRAKVSQVAVNDLADETGTDISTFICALHENYPPSCDGDQFTDSLNACIESLSDSDLLSGDRRATRGARAATGLGAASMNASVDMLRQDEISFQTAARGLLFALPYPVKRRLTSVKGGSRAADVHKLLYPSLLRLWRKAEEIEGLVDQWMKHLLDPFDSTHLSARGTGPATGSIGVKAWKSHPIGHPSLSLKHAPRTVTMMPRSDALLHQFPYMAQIQRSSPDGWQLNQITSVRGSFLDDNMEEDEPAPSSRPQSNPPPNPSSNAFGPRLPQEEEEKLILSDDDIVDD